MCNFIVNQLLVGIVFHCKLLQQHRCLWAVLHRAAPAEYNGALHKRRPRFLFDSFVSVDGEAYLVTGVQGVDLMPRTRAMKINFLSSAIVKEIDGYCIRVTVVPVYGKDGKLTFTLRNGMEIEV